MNPSEPEAFSLLDFSRQEIKMQTKNLLEAISGLKDPSSSSDSLEKAKKSVHELIKLLGIQPFSILIPSIQNLENFLETIQEGKSIESQYLEMLSGIVEELLQVAESDNNQLEENLKKYNESINQKSSQLKQLSEGLPVDQSKNEEEIQPAKSNKKKLHSPKIFSEWSFDPTMFDLFCVEIDSQSKILNEGLMEIERKSKDPKILESLMRAAHSIKGAARVVNLNQIVRLAHVMEDCFVKAQHEQKEIPIERIDQLLRGVDFLGRLSKIHIHEVQAWGNEQIPFIESLIEELTSTEIKAPLAKSKASPTKGKEPVSKNENALPKGKKKKQVSIESSIPSAPIKNKPKEEFLKTETKKDFRTSFHRDRVLRITAENLNRLMGLAGESLVESHLLHPFGENLQNFKNRLRDIEKLASLLRESVDEENLNDLAKRCLSDLSSQLNDLHLLLNERILKMDQFILRQDHLSDRLYQEVINSRMRPFEDGVEAFPRMARDVARLLGKQVKIEIEGKSTPVDRDILEKLESPLSHLIRNAIDHGIEPPEERVAAGKPAEGLIKLEARHRAGMLAITVSDDGRGIDMESMRRKIVEKNLISAEMAAQLSDSEVMDFLFLPGFSTSEELTEISGRGVGLNVVQSTLQEVGGIVHTQSFPGKGMSFHLQLPLTLSVIHALIVEISGEPYAFPLAQIDQAFLLPCSNIKLIENRQFFHYKGQNIGLVIAWEVLNLNEPEPNLDHLSIIVLKEHLNSYGLIVDRFIGEKELVVQELDLRLGKVPNISTGALMEDGSPLLIVDIEDLIRSIDYLLSGGRLKTAGYAHAPMQTSMRKRILVVDDSMTVREVESRLLLNQGYEVETAVNGMDGWNAVRLGNYDLVITDIDMPRMTGIELLRAIKSDPKLHNLPVMIVSYKEGEEDRLKGKEAGADYYLTKSSFQDATLIKAVKDLLGEA